MSQIYTLPSEFLPKEAKKKSWKIFLLIGVGVLLLVGGSVVAYYLTREKMPAVVVAPVPAPLPPPAPSGLIVPEPPAPPVVPPPEATPPPPVPGESRALVNAADDDSDGLSNDEELLFKTDPSNADTDGDTFIDGNEVFNLYNPAQSAPVNLVDSGLVKVFNNSKQNYEVFYPSDFELDIIDTTSTAMVALKIKSGERFIITVIENTAGTAPLNYYLNQHPEVSITELSSTATKGGLSGIKSPDKLEILLSGEGVLYSISYDPGNNTIKRYGRAFEMMVNSFKKR